MGLYTQETVHCRVSRGGDAVRRAKAAATVTVLLLCLAAGFVLAPCPLWAAPPAPAMAPGFPLMAGPVVMVMWGPVPGATGYFVYVNGKEVAKNLPPVPYQFPTPEVSGDYVIEVAAVGADGVVGAKSAPGKITVIKLLPPKEIATIVGEKNINLRWTNQPGTMIVDIFRSEKKDGEYKLLTSVQENRYADTAVEVGKTYFYKFKSKDISGKESAFSEIAIAALSKAPTVEASKVAELKLKKSRVTLITPSKPFVPNDLIVDKDRMYVLDRNDGVIHAYDFEGKFLSSIGQRGYLAGQLLYPAGFARLSNGNFVVADLSRKAVIVMTPEGELVKEWKVQPAKGETEAKPWKVAVNSKDEIYVSDDKSLTIARFRPDGTLLGTFGGKTAGAAPSPDLYQGIGNMVFSPDDTLYVSDFRAGDVHVVDKGDKTTMKIGYPAGVGAFIQPGKAIVDEKKKAVLVPDQMMATVQAFEVGTGKYLYTLTNETGEVHESKQRGVWAIGNPVALAWGPGGAIFGVNSLDRVFFKIEVLE